MPRACPEHGFELTFIGFLIFQTGFEVFVFFLCFFFFLFFLFFVFYFIKISKFALPGVMLMYERTFKDRKKERKACIVIH